ncbi:MAG: dihydrolipoyl dehydrogenase [Candidatus Methanoperedens sp.]|nr:dihydrolipoyl dehydrogenase [Candidatus Methanoperedens sp.]
MIKYDLIVIGTGSGMNYVGSILEKYPGFKIAVIDKDEPGGICLTRGCIPSKLLLYPAELIRTIGTAGKFGVDVEVKNIDFNFIMNNMRSIISEDIASIRKGLSSDPNIDYYNDVAQFISPYTLKVGDKTITSEMIFLCTGSKTIVPKVKGLDEAGYLTSDTILKMNKLPANIAIIGGGYIAAEYGHFFSSMGSKVTIIGRNKQFIPEEEPEISLLAKREMSKDMDIFTGHEVVEVQKMKGAKKKVIAKSGAKKVDFVVDEIIVASGRGPDHEILHPEKGGIKTDPKGWIVVDDHLETTQSNIWAFGDANGKFLFKHVANYESRVVFYNAILKKKVKVDYHAVPYAVFSYPEISSVGMGEKEAVEKYGAENILIGFEKFEDTGKGHAMALKDYFVKIIFEKNAQTILGAHIIGPYASILIQEIVNLMYTKEESREAVIQGMHIHPSLSEVVQRAFYSLMPLEHYHHVLGHMGLNPDVHDKKHN